MSDLNTENVKLLGRLCRIRLTDQEIEALALDLKRVLDYAEQLQEVDISDLSPHSHIEEQSIETLRKDEVENVLSRETFLTNAPDQVGGMIRVPPVINKISE